jgi:tetratricopeptide (TPR) repeat protein
VVVSGEPTGQPWRDRIIDIRVDDSPEPLIELRRLLNVSRAYDHMNRGDEFIAEEDFEAANREYAAAAELSPGNPEILFWHAVTLATAGEVELSLPIFKRVFEVDESWRVLVPRLVDAEILPDDSNLVEQIIWQ